MKKTLPRRVLLTGLVIVPLLIGATVLFFGIGSWLLVRDPEPQRLDIVFTFAGENARMAYSRDLMERHTGAHWVLNDFHHLYSRILSRNGFAMERVSVIDTASHTLSEVNALSDWLRVHRISGAKILRDPPSADTQGKAKNERLHIGLVSSPYHMRRISFMVRDAFRANDTRYAFYFLPVPFERYSWNRSDLAAWWRTKTTRKYVESEIGKLIIYWLFMQRRAHPVRETG
jgi:uncharacterized SAM-binding protein YcdF (DUF218 family)